jgi:DNA-binding transcriptional MerR regulator
MSGAEPVRQTRFIGEVARLTGLSIHTIRFYEEERLLPVAARTESGYRTYSTQEVEQLKFIKKAQELGFSLKDIRELLVLKDQSTDPCSHVKALVEEKLQTVGAKRRELAAIEKELKRVLVQCQRQLKRQRPGPERHCPVLIKLARKV